MTFWFSLNSEYVLKYSDWVISEKQYGFRGVWIIRYDTPRISCFYLTDKSLRHGGTDGIHNIVYHRFMPILRAIKCELIVRNKL